jgi:hypothetical protein
MTNLEILRDHIASDPEHRFQRAGASDTRSPHQNRRSELGSLEIIDRVTSHLLAQKERSARVESCKYRFEGLKCAVGCLIDDEHYSEKLEGRGASHYDVLQAVEASIGEKPDPDLLDVLQAIHDIEDPKGWEFELKKLRRNYE